MAISYSQTDFNHTSKLPSLVKLFGEKAFDGAGAILLGAQDQGSDAERIGGINLDPHARTEKQKLVAILKTDGPKAAMNKTLEKLDSGEISMELANIIADELYASGYHKEAKAFTQTLDIKAIDPMMAQAELDKQRELKEPAAQLQIKLDQTQPQQQMTTPKPGSGLKSF